MSRVPRNLPSIKLVFKLLHDRGHERRVVAQAFCSDKLNVIIAKLFNLKITVEAHHQAVVIDAGEDGPLEKLLALFFRGTATLSVARLDKGGEQALDLLIVQKGVLLQHVELLYTGEGSRA